MRFKDSWCMQFAGEPTRLGRAMGMPRAAQVAAGAQWGQSQPTDETGTQTRGGITYGLPAPAPAPAPARIAFASSFSPSSRVHLLVSIFTFRSLADSLKLTILFPSRPPSWTFHRFYPCNQSFGLCLSLPALFRPQPLEIPLPASETSPRISSFNHGARFSPNLYPTVVS